MNAVLGDRLPDEQRRMRDEAHRFAAEVLRPAGLKLDRMPAEAAAAPDSPLFDVLKKAAALGYTRLRGPTNLGGLQVDPVTSYLIGEELAWGNLGLAAVIALAGVHADLAIASGNTQAIAEFAEPFYGSADGSVIGCWALTEPDHGSDWLSAMRPELCVPTRAQLVARRDGDDWILNGQKSAWVSNAPIATHAMLNVQIADGATLNEAGVCILPLDLPGVSRGNPVQKHGVRSLPQGELFFEDVRIPKRWMLVEPEAHALFLHGQLASFNAGVGCAATGLARAAYESALAYAKERVQGGRPIFEHQSVRARLFHMYSLVEACRGIAQRAYVDALSRIAEGQMPVLERSIASKVFCTRAALEVATLAVQLHGSNGITSEYPVEMFMRDAAVLTIADGENAMLAQIAASLL